MTLDFSGELPIERVICRPHAWKAAVNMRNFRPCPLLSRCVVAFATVTICRPHVFAIATLTACRPHAWRLVRHALRYSSLPEQSERISELAGLH